MLPLVPSCPTVVLVPVILHSGEGAGDGAGEAKEIMECREIKDQDGPCAVIFEGARGVDKPARASAKGALRMVGDRECRGIKAGRARRIR